MINYKTVRTYCCEDIANIENYEKALSSEKRWDCHHRGELLPCGSFSIADLKKFGLYWKRPASELIFLTAAEHRRLHNSGNAWGSFRRSDATKKKMSASHRKTPIAAYKDGKLVGEYESQIAAAKALGVPQGNIGMVVRGKCKQTHGYVFERRAS